MVGVPALGVFALENDTAKNADDPVTQQTVDEYVENQQGLEARDITKEDLKNVDEDAGEVKEKKKVETGFDYILKHADKKYVGDLKSLNPLYSVVVTQTFFDKGDIPEEEKVLDKIMQTDRDGDGIGDNVKYFAGQYMTEGIVYEGGKGSKYCVMYGATAQNDQIVIKDMVAGEASEGGVVFDDIICDQETGLIYIPNSRLTETQDGKNCLFRAQVLYELLPKKNQENGDIKTNISVNVKAKNIDGDVPTKGEVISGLYGETTVVKLANDQEAEGEIKPNTIDSVVVNGKVLEEDKYAYNKETGQIVISAPPVTVKDITIELENNVKKDIENVWNSFTGTKEKAQAESVNGGQWLYGNYAPSIGDDGQIRGTISTNNNGIDPYIIDVSRYGSYQYKNDKGELVDLPFELSNNIVLATMVMGSGSDRTGTIGQLDLVSQKRISRNIKLGSGTSIAGLKLSSQGNFNLGCVSLPIRNFTEGANVRPEDYTHDGAGVAGSFSNQGKIHYRICDVKRTSSTRGIVLIGFVSQTIEHSLGAQAGVGMFEFNYYTGNPSEEEVTKTTPPQVPTADLTIKLNKQDELTGNALDGGQFSVTIDGSNKGTFSADQLRQGKTFQVQGSSVRGRGTGEYWDLDDCPSELYSKKGVPRNPNTSSYRAEQDALTEAQADLQRKLDNYKRTNHNVVITEVVAPPGHKKGSQTSWSGQVSGIREFTTTVTNPGNCKVKLFKHDVQNNPVGDATFELKLGSRTLYSNVKTGADGYLTFEKLTPNTTYTITETKEPNGYMKPRDDEKTKTVTTGGENSETEVDFVNHRIAFIKYDGAGNPLAGAKFGVYEQGSTTPVDQWITTDIPHAMKNLTMGKTYVVKEDTVPGGYVAMEGDITFTATEDQVDVDVEGVNPARRIIKKDSKGGYVNGAEMEIKKDGAVVDSWTSGAVLVNGFNGSAGKINAGSLTSAVSKYYNGRSVKNAKATVFGKEFKLSITFNDDTQDHFEMDKNGKETAHLARGLSLKQNYILHEKKAPAGYARAVDLAFNTNDATNKDVVMIDPKPLASKLDTFKNKIEGATMQVLNDAGTVVDQWVSGKTDHAISNLDVGKSYVLHQETTPKGFVHTPDIPFSLPDKQKGNLNPTLPDPTYDTKHDCDYYVEMIDPVHYIDKVDRHGNYVTNAKMTVIKDGQKVDSWTTGQKIVNIPADKKTAIEALTDKNSEVVFTDGSKNCTVRISDYTEAQKADMIKKSVSSDPSYTGDRVNRNPKAYKLMVVENGNYSYYEISSEGIELGHHVRNTNADVQYTVQETTPPQNYIKATDKNFTTPATKDGRTGVVDHIVEFLKKDVSGNPIVGAVMQAIDKTTGDVVDEWTTTKEIYMINNLVLGGKYTLHQKYTPDGFVWTPDFDIDIKEPKDYYFEMIDPIHYIDKVDIDGVYVKDAKMQVIDKDGNVIDQWVSGRKIVDLTADETKKLEAGQFFTATKNGKQYTFSASDYTEEAKANRIKELIGSAKAPKNVKSFKVMEKNGDKYAYYEIDSKGNELGHRVSNSKSSVKYTIQETEAPENFVKARDQEMSTPPNKDERSAVVDHQVRFLKKDVSGNPIVGAVMQAINKKTGDVVDEWTTTEKVYRINHLVLGGEYTLHQKYTPDGFVWTPDFDISITEPKDYYFEMIDPIHYIDKVDTKGHYIEGAEMRAVDKVTGDELETWTTRQQIVELTEEQSAKLEAGEMFTFDKDGKTYKFMQSDDDHETLSGKLQDLVKSTESPLDNPKALKLMIKDGDHYGYYEVDSQGKELGHRLSFEKSDHPYVIEEVKAPGNYVKAPNKEVTTPPDEDKRDVVVDTLVTSLKVDVQGKPIVGAKMQVIDNETKDVVDEWVSGEEIHTIPGLDATRHYTLHQAETPNGFVHTPDLPIEIPEPKDYYFEMVDPIHVIDKFDEKGEYVKGAQMQIIDKKGNIIDQWISGQNIIKLTEEQSEAVAKDGELSFEKDGTQYNFKAITDRGVEEVQIPNPDKENTEDNENTESNESTEAPETTETSTQPQPETVDDGDSTTSDEVIDNPADSDQPADDSEDNGNIIDDIVDFITGKRYTIFTLQTIDAEGHYSYYEVDNKGNELGHRVSHNLSDVDYIIQEVKAPDTYVKASDKEMMTPAKEDRRTDIIDTQYSFTKEDINGEEVEGAKIQVLNSKNEVVDEWISGKEPHNINNLEVGQKYTLREEVTPNGYVQANAIDIEVTNDGINAKFKLVDTIHRIIKVDDQGLPVKDARLGIYDSKGKKVDEWVTGAHILDLPEEAISTANAEGIARIEPTEVTANITEEQKDEVKLNLNRALKLAFPNLYPEEPSDTDNSSDVSTEESSESTDNSSESTEVDSSTVVAQADDETVVDPTNPPESADELEKPEVLPGAEDEDGNHVDEVVLTKEDYIKRAFEALNISADELDQKVAHVIEIIESMEIEDLQHLEDVKAEIADYADQTIQEVQDAINAQNASVDQIYLLKNDYSDGGYTLRYVNTDGTMKYVDVDEYGDEANHRVSGITAGETYILRELKSPFGMTLAPDMEFTADGVTDIKSTMIDKPLLLMSSQKTGATEAQLYIYLGAGMLVILMGAGVYAIIKKNKK